MNRPKIMFYVQHLLGIGHVFRAMRVAKELARAGCETHIVWGGTRIPNMDVSEINMHYLQAVHVNDENFRILLLDDGTPIDETGKKKRTTRLLDLFYSVRPDIVITEAFPFGRRQMRFELVPLMEAAKDFYPRPLIVCSIRDILQENRTPKRVQESLDAIHEWFDMVMVHGDPDFIPVQTTLERADEISGKIRYTGLVTPGPVDFSIPPSIIPSVIVSAGGGAVGKTLMQVAVDAMELCNKFPDNWVLSTGPDLPQEEFDLVKSLAPDGMQIIRFITDLANVMARARVSVSRAGYNTIGDLLRAQCPAVLVPFDGGMETEQLRRARIMEEKGLANILLEKELSPQTLAATIDRTTGSGREAKRPDLNGAERSAQLLMNEFFIQKKRPGS